jgi:hypothetical protein
MIRKRVATPIRLRAAGGGRPARQPCSPLVVGAASTDSGITWNWFTCR